MKLIKAFMFCGALAVAVAGLAEGGEEPRLPPQSVNVNTADEETLALALDGVGPATAQAIVEHRRENGVFESVEDLTAVRGIGERTLEINAARIRVED